MNCKNCQAELHSEHKYCDQCGAMVINERISIKSLISGLLISLGWDNQFFVTFRDLVLKPQSVFEKYLNGTRKRYTNPFTFFAIGTALSVFILSFYSDELINISTKASFKSSETLIDIYKKEGYSSEKSNKKADFIEKKQILVKKIFIFMYKYYYYLSFLLLPFYALIALLVYGKPDNYGEHLVINAYIHGLLFIFGLLLFFLTLQLGHGVYSNGTLLLTLIYYLYAYKKYRKQTIGKTILMLLKFLAIILVFLFLIFMIRYLIGILIAR